jgi:hypothetical protein
VVTTFDPDGIVATRGLGAVAHEPAALAMEIAGLLRDAARWQRAAQAGRAYYEQHHAPEVVLPQFERIFIEVARESLAHRGGAR